MMDLLNGRTQRLEEGPGPSLEQLPQLGDKRRRRSWQKSTKERPVQEKTARTGRIRDAQGTVSGRATEGPESPLELAVWRLWVI